MKKSLLSFLFLVILFAFQPRDTPKLKEVFKADFYIGTAVNLNQVTGKEPGADSLLSLHFNSLTPENGLKWALVHPQEDRYDFAFGDAFVKKGEEIGAFLVGHTLVWHQQTPQWVFKNADGEFLSKVDLTKRMEAHISEVVGRYKGRIHGWDVVNEAFEDDGTWRKTHWYNIMGEDFIRIAFEKARETDPEAKLFYNDYNVWKPEKRKAILEMAKKLKAQGVRIDGIGMQGHYRIQFPGLDLIEQAILDIHAAGFQVSITELDIDVLPRPSDSDGADLNLNFAESEKWNPYPNGLPKEMEAQLVDRYASLMKLFQKHADKIDRVTFWGLHDGRSWLNNWPARGRKNYPLLFDREMKLKQGFLEAFDK